MTKENREHLPQPAAAEQGTGGDGEKMLEVTRVMMMEITVVSCMTERQYLEGALREDETRQLAKKLLPKEWNVDDVTMVRLQDFVMEASSGVQEENADTADTQKRQRD